MAGKGEVIPPGAYLSVADRPRAVALCESLHRAAELWSAGADTATIERTMRETLSSHGVVIDYAALADPESLDPLPKNATSIPAFSRPP